MTVRIIALREIAEISAGNPAPQDTMDFSDDGEPFVRMQDVGREHHTRSLSQTVDKVSAEAIGRYRLRRFPAGTLLIPKSGASINLNHRALLARDAFVVSHLATVIPDTSKIDADYLYFWSLSYDPRSQAQTTSLPSLPTSLIKAAQIPLPSLPEQHRIVDLLSRAEGIVRLCREAQAKAAELIPALFLDMFGEPTSNPKGLPVVALGGCVEILDSMRRPIKESEREKRIGNIPYYGANGQVGWIDEPIFNENLVLVAEDGGHFDEPDKGVAYAIEGPAWVNNHAHVLRPAKNVDWQFLHWHLRHFNFKPFITGTTRGKLTQGDLRRVPVLTPPIDLQRQFATKAEAIRAIATQQAAALDKAQATFDALLHRAFAT